MSQRDDLLFLEDIRDYALHALSFVKGRMETDIHHDQQLAFAVVRALEVIGEAAARVPTALRDRYPDVPWREIVGMRNMLIHGYTRVDYELVWEVVVERLPQLVVQVDNILADEARS